MAAAAHPSNIITTRLTANPNEYKVAASAVIVIVSSRVKVSDWYVVGHMSTWKGEERLLRHVVYTEIHLPDKAILRSCDCATQTAYKEDEGAKLLTQPMEGFYSATCCWEAGTLVSEITNMVATISNPGFGSRADRRTGRGSLGIFEPGIDDELFFFLS